MASHGRALEASLPEAELGRSMLIQRIPEFDATRLQLDAAAAEELNHCAP